MKYIYLSLFMVISHFMAFGQGWEEIEITEEKLSESIYVLYGRGGNMAVCIGKDGTFLIDDQYAPLTDKIVSKIAELTDNPVKFIVNTHWHGDHTGGNENFAGQGAILMAHENVRKRLSTDQFMKAFSREVKAKPEAAWPVITFSDNMSLYLNGEDILVIHVHNAHTDGDSFVFFAKSNILHMGDTFFKGRYPFIDLSSGGTVDGLLQAIDNALMLSDSETKIIPGHGTMANISDLKMYRSTISTIKERVAEAIASGKSFEEIQAAGLSAEYDDEWGSGFIKPEAFINTIYTDLTRGEK